MKDPYTRFLPQKPDKFLSTKDNPLMIKRSKRDQRQGAIGLSAEGDCGTERSPD